LPTDDGFYNNNNNNNNNNRISIPPLVVTSEAKMHQIRFWLGPLGELTALPRPSSWIWGLLLREGERKRGEGIGGEGEGSVPIVPVLRNDHWTVRLLQPL